MNRRGLTFWYNTALVTFGVVALGITWSVMSSGFSSSDVMKEVVEEAVQDSANNLQVIGKITGSADVSDAKIKVTSTPITSTTTGLVDMRPQNIKVTYKIIKLGSHEISYDDIYSGMLNGTASSLGDALIKAKEQGLISANPNMDEKPDTTSAFLYWVIQQNDDVFLESNEIANLVVVYSDKDRPISSEFIKLQVEESEGMLLDIQRTIPTISGSVVDLGGKIKN
jgi:archaeal flagellin FlaB